MAPIVSVIMAVRNEEQRVGLAIASILGQTISDLELVAVDDASTDGTAKVLQSFADADPRVIVLSSSTNMGRSQARNLALREARADLVAILDADDMMMPDRLEMQVKYMTTNPEVGMLGTWAYYLLPDVCQIRLAQPPIDDATIRRRLASRVMPFVHPSMVLRRKLLLSSGGYVAWSKKGNEDLYTCSRLITKTKGASIPEPLLIYSAHGLLQGSRLVDRYQEIIEIENSRSNCSLNFSGRMNFLARKLIAGYIPPSFYSELVRERLQRWPKCSEVESGKVANWIAVLDRNRLEIENRRNL